MFSVDEANAMLPLVRAIVRDLIEVSGGITERRQRLGYLVAGREPNSEDPYWQELEQVQEELRNDTRRLGEYVEELHRLGVEPKSATEGLVDFPSVIDGRPVYLCWKFDEAEVLYFHDREAGFAGRRRLQVETTACHGDAQSQHESP